MASLFGEKTVKPKLLVFSNFDWIFVCVVVLLLGLFLVTPFFSYNNQAIPYMVQKKYDKAEKKWLQALNKKSLIPFYRMNLALNYLLSHQADKAIQENMIAGNLVKQIKKQKRFKEQPDPRLRGDDGGLRGGRLSGDDRFSREARYSRESGNPEETKGENPKKKQASTRHLLDQYEKKVLFYSFFNSAIAATVKGEMKNVLNFYQKALSVQPESLEVKTNIELLMNTNASSKDKKNSSKNSDNQEKKEREEGKEEERESEKSKESQNQDKEKNKKGDNNQNSSDDTKEEKRGKKGKENDSENQKGSSEKSSIDKKQQEAILKAILEGEKKIRERRNKSGKNSSAIEKDW